MKTLYKAVILSVLGLGTIATAQAQATYKSDLIICFTTTTGNDVEFDAGTVVLSHVFLVNSLILAPSSIFLYSFHCGLGCHCQRLLQPY